MAKANFSDTFHRILVKRTKPSLKLVSLASNLLFTGYPCRLSGGYFTKPCGIRCGLGVILGE